MLAFGLGSGLILVLAAFADGGAPESAGRAELVSTAARIAEAVKIGARQSSDVGGERYRSRLTIRSSGLTVRERRVHALDRLRPVSCNWGRAPRANEALEDEHTTEQ